MSITRLMHTVSVPLGIVSTTGVAGFTLGGGTGYFTRKHGLTVDNLLEADVVLANGSVVTASEREHQDLFWAIRGGGGNFGVVTSFLFRAHPVKMVFAGPIFWDAVHARQVMRAYRDFLPTAPEDLGIFVGLKTVPSMDPFPKEGWGKRACAIIGCYNGSVEDGQRVLAPLLDKLPPPIFNWMGEMPFPAINALFDPFFPKGLQWYWKGDFVKSLSDEAIDAHIAEAAKAPTELCLMHLYPIDGAVKRVARDATPWGARDASFSMVIAGISPEPRDAEALKSWGRAYWKAVHPFNMGGGYVNFMFDDEADGRVQAAYGDNYRATDSSEEEVRPEQPVQGQSEHRAGPCVSATACTVIYATLALLAFAANSILCRLALREATIDRPHSRPFEWYLVRPCCCWSWPALEGTLVVARSGRGRHPRCSSCTRCRFPSPTHG